MMVELNKERRAAARRGRSVEECPGAVVAVALYC